MSKTLSVARDFSRSPAGRFRSDGQYSGEEFRERLLWPALEEFDQLEVDLDGVLGFGSSFLEEAFGGLVRVHGISAADLRRRLVIRSALGIYKNRVWKYVEDAQRDATTKKP
jgi:hypothetical protein